MRITHLLVGPILMCLIINVMVESVTIDNAEKDGLRFSRWCSRRKPRLWPHMWFEKAGSTRIVA